MTVNFVSPDRQRERTVYCVGREPAVGEHVTLHWEEREEGEELGRMKGFRGEVEKVIWDYGEKTNEQRCMILLK
jgi:hypothetical protein